MMSTVMQLHTPVAHLSDGVSVFSGPTRPTRALRESAKLIWKSSPEMPLDLQGPIDRPFDCMGAGFASVPAIEHLIPVAARFADKVAVSDGAHQLTYSDLLDRVLTLAQAIAKTIPEGQAVGSLLRNSVWQPIAMLGCMAAGRILVPLNPRDPVQRLSTIAAAARISVLIGQDSGISAEWVEKQGLQWLDITRASELPNSVSPLAPVSVDAPAVVLYTSGSTGQPKGVVNSQRSLLQRVQQYVDACHTNAADVFMPLSGPTTIAGCREMLSALLTGARLQIVDVETLGLRGLLREIRSQRVTITYVVPTLLRALINAGELADFESLRVVRIGGEKVLWTDIALVRKVVQHACFVQISYLSTETTGSQWFLPNDWAEDDVGVPVGYLLPGISFAVIDESGSSVPDGEVGELVIKSRYVLLGYWENGEITPALPDPDDPKSRIFPTGDLVVVDARGLTRVIGRKGRQLKINGRRVEPAEIETVLRKLPYVRDAVAIVTDANELVVFASSVDQAMSSFTTNIWNVVRQMLPTALHPTRLHEIPEIPRMTGGKVDLARLKVLDLENRKSSPAPRPAAIKEMVKATELVQQVWTGILGTADAGGRWDEAGGDSLKLLRCVMDLEEAIGRELNMEAFTVGMSAADMIHVLANDARSGPAQSDSELIPPLVIFPGSMGYGPSLAAFGAQLSKVTNLIPIRYPDLTTTLTGCNSVGEMAALAMEQIRAAQPRGDIRLIGYSLGGGVAFEVATQLIAEGRSVKFLGILDTNISPRRHNYRETVSRTLQRIGSHRITIHRMLCRTISKCVVRLGWQVPFCQLLDWRIWSRLSGTRFILRLELEEILRMQAFDRWRTTSKARLPITGTIFACNRRSTPVHLGWESLFTQVDVIPIAGGHLDLVIEPHLAVNLPVIQRAVASSYS